MNETVQLSQKSAQLSSTRASELQGILAMGFDKKHLYFEGSLAQGGHMDKDLKLFAEVLREYHEAGILSLTQKRISDGVYEYYVQRCRNDTAPAKYTPPPLREARIVSRPSQVWR